MNKAFQAKMISDDAMLACVWKLQNTPIMDLWGTFTDRVHWTSTRAVAAEWDGVPFKVVHAKLRQLLKRGLIDGCPCGCRGDWEITAAGRQRLTAA